jgi:hypothetical protein
MCDREAMSWQSVERDTPCSAGSPGRWSGWQVGEVEAQTGAVVLPTGGGAQFAGQAPPIPRLVVGQEEAQPQAERVEGRRAILTVKMLGKAGSLFGQGPSTGNANGTSSLSRLVPDRGQAV